MGRRVQPVALREVARQAGVSLGTASNVFAGRCHVAPATRAAVLNAATALGYQPRPRRSTRAARRIGMVGLLLRQLDEPLLANPFYSLVLHGAQAACAARGVGLTHETVAEAAGRLPLMVSREHVGGLLVVGAINDGVLAMLRSAGVPLVLVDSCVKPPFADSVCGDDEEGGYLATRYLIEHGHRDPAPACIVGQLRHPSLRDRLGGYRRALAESRLAVPDAYVQLAPSGPERDAEHGYAAMRVLLDQPRPPTAVFCVNDTIAIGAMRALRERGLAVPAHCSLVGYDDIALATHAVPPLTTIRVDKELLGAQAVRHLLERIEWPEMALRQTRLAVTLIERASVAAPPS